MCPFKRKRGEYRRRGETREKFIHIKVPTDSMCCMQYVLYICNAILYCTVFAGRKHNRMIVYKGRRGRGLVNFTRCIIYNDFTQKEKGEQTGKCIILLKSSQSCIFVAYGNNKCNVLFQQEKKSQPCQRIRQQYSTTKNWLKSL